MRTPPTGPPTGTVTFLFTDIEGSTALVQRFGERWPALLERHRAAMRRAFGARGWEVGTEGDSFFVVFERALDAVTAVAAAQRELATMDSPDDGPIRVRMGLLTGEGDLSGGDYVGLDVHRAARIAAAGHGGQVLLAGSTASLVAAALPAGLALVDLGEHRLKDLPQPERVHQLVIDGLPAAFPPLRSLGGRPTNLPGALSSMVGRESDLAAVAGLLQGARLVSVTGPGGTGKSRLVQELARTTAERFPDGAIFVPLETVRDSDLIPEEILRALKLDVATSTPARERLLGHLAARKALLVLDNLEQLPGAAAVVQDLLNAAPEVTVLIASQAPLHLAAESEYPLQPLPEDAAVRLFVERARSVRPGFELDDGNRDAITAISARLEGLPLAVELAAAQVKVLTPQAILSRIEDRLDSLASRRQDLPERQRTLGAAVRWSYELLAAPEQAMLRRLSVFVGGVRLSELEAFEARRDAAADALSTMEALVDRSLVVVRTGSDGETRFAMLEAIRSFARGQLAEQGETSSAVADHAVIYHGLAVASEQELYGPRRRACLDHLADDHANIRAALDHLEATDDIASALEMCIALWRFWQGRGHLIEGHERIERLIERAAGMTGLTPALLSRAEEAAGSMGYWMRTIAGPSVEPHYERSLALARESGDSVRIAWAMYNLAFLYDFVPGLTAGEADTARGSQLRQEALERFREAGDRRGIGESLWALGGSPTIIRDDPEYARQHLVEATKILDEIGDLYGSSWATFALGLLDANLGRLEQARVSILRAAGIFLRDEDLAGQLVAVNGLASLAARAGDDATAIRLESVVVLGAHRIGLEPQQIPPIMEPLAQARARMTAAGIAEAVASAEGLEPRACLEAAIAEGGAAQ